MARNITEWHFPNTDTTMTSGSWLANMLNLWAMERQAPSVNKHEPSFFLLHAWEDPGQVRCPHIGQWLQYQHLHPDKQQYHGLCSSNQHNMLTLLENVFNCWPFHYCIFTNWQKNFQGTRSLVDVHMNHQVQRIQAASVSKSQSWWTFFNESTASMITT